MYINEARIKKILRKPIKNRWIPVYQGRSSTTFEQTLSTGSVWTKTTHWTGEIYITRYPSVSYMENELMGLNSGAKTRLWTAEQ